MQRDPVWFADVVGRSARRDTGSTQRAHDPFRRTPREAHDAWWRARIDAAGSDLEAADLDVLARRFRIGPGAITEAVATAIQIAGLRVAGEEDDESALVDEVSRNEDDSDAMTLAYPTLDELSAAVRRQNGHALAALAQRIEPSARRENLVVPDDIGLQLRELCQRVINRDRVMHEWEFGRQPSRRPGITALFSGPMGTGKTMAAEIVAAEMGLDLFVVNLAGIAGRRAGEIEQCLDNIFAAAQGVDVVLFFDEADALLGNCSAVRDSEDHHATIMNSYILHKMEKHDGLTILTAESHQFFHESFLRKLTFSISFPFPEEVDRQRIWPQKLACRVAVGRRRGSRRPRATVQVEWWSNQDDRHRRRTSGRQRPDQCDDAPPSARRAPGIPEARQAPIGI